MANLNLSHGVWLSFGWAYSHSYPRPFESGPFCDDGIPNTNTDATLWNTPAELLHGRKKSHDSIVHLDEFPSPCVKVEFPVFLIWQKSPVPPFSPSSFHWIWSKLSLSLSLSSVSLSPHSAFLHKSHELLKLCRITYISYIIQLSLCTYILQQPSPPPWVWSNRYRKNHCLGISDYLISYPD